MELSTCARPYARAIFETALEHNRLEAWSHFLQVALAVAQDKRVRRLQFSPCLSKNDKAALYTNLLSQLVEQVEQKEKNFLQILAQNERLTLLPHIASTFEALKLAHDNRVMVTVLSVYPLESKQKEQLVLKLNRRLGCKVNINEVIDQSLIGGLVIKYDDQVIDGSVRSKLSAMANAINF